MSDVRPHRSRGDRGGQQLPDNVEEAPGGEFHFVRGVLLVLEEELEQREGFRDFLDARGRIGRELGDGILEFREVQDVLGTLAAVEERFGPGVGIEPDYVFLGAQTIKGGPWDEVEPASPPDWLDSDRTGRDMLVGILDTGIAYDPKVHPRLDGRFTADPTEDRDVPNDDPTVPFLAEQGGHGTFVAGLVSHVAPAAHLAIARVLKADGFGSTSSVLEGLRKVRGIAAKRVGGRLDVLNLSLGAYTRDDQPLKILARPLRSLVAAGTVIVAAAGNHGSPRPFWPAAMPEVIGVGAPDGWGPAIFTNYGPWVDVCAPGVDVVSTFFDETGGPLFGADLPPGPGSAGAVAVTFPGFGRWSGTSFAAPKVAGAIAAAATTWSVSPAEAADRLVRDWRLYRVPDLGAVVNVS
ncbi:MAG TPA: S8 family serine peptidase [Mycobacteriales bacterium]|nr:S8 family serine peptidase [Mycobacteriales bacterium]